jgi:hypothetical protein
MHSLQCQNKLALFPGVTEDCIRQLYTDNDISRAVESFKNAVQQASWSVMLISSNPHINNEYSSAIKEKLAEKKKLHKQTNRLQINKLNHAIKALKHLLNSKRNQEIHEYLNKLSVTSEINYSLWKVIKRLKRPQIQYLSIRKQDGS